MLTTYTCAFLRAERTSNRCNCQPSWSETTKEGMTIGSGGGCADDIPLDDTPGWCYVIPETCKSPPQRRHGIPWDVCVGASFTSNSPLHVLQDDELSDPL